MAKDYRKKVDTEQCYFCPKRNGIEVHHIVPQRFNGTDTRENLVALCDRCHKKLEQLYDKRFYEKLGIADETGERKQHFQCFECDDRAEVSMSYKEGPLWFCLHHATQRYIESSTWSVHRDLSGRMSQRLDWIDSRYSHIKS
jgi:hypothetical protein